MTPPSARTLLFGPAGSGKTRRVLDLVGPLLAPGAQGRFEPFLVLVPTYSQAEHLKRRLLRASQGGGLLDRGVVTFEQLAERRTGLRLASLAPMAVRDAVLSAAFAEAADPAFGGAERFAGLRRAALRFLDEVKALEPEPGADVVRAAALRIAGAAGTFAEQRRALVTGLVRVLGVYERRRAAAGLRDHGDLLRELLAKLRRDGAGRCRLFAMDGFTDLTPVQAAIVEHLAAAADASIATLPGETEDRDGAPFAACEGLRRRLVAAGFRPEFAGPSRRFGGAGLAGEGDALFRLKAELRTREGEGAPGREDATSRPQPEPRTREGEDAAAETGCDSRRSPETVAVACPREARPHVEVACPAEARPPHAVACPDEARPPVEFGVPASAGPSAGGRETPPSPSALARLERLLAGDDVAAAPPDPSVRFLAGADPDDEADRVARTVLGWTTEGVPRAEILVIVRGLGSETAARVLDALRRHGVPVRRMGGEPLAGVPVVRSALRAIRLLAGSGDAADLVAALRHGDARGVTDRDADRVGVLVRERGVRTEDDVLALAREAGAETVLGWHRRLDTARAAGPPASRGLAPRDAPQGEGGAALSSGRQPHGDGRGARPGPAPRPPAAVARDLLAPLADLLRLRFLEPAPPEDEASVARDAAALRAVRDLAGDLVSALRAGATPEVTPAEFAARLAAAADTARFSPPERRDDVVHVVDAEEARQWEARAVVVCGLRMGEFPAPGREDVFLTDEERAQVEAATGLALPGRMDAALRRESLLFYSAATRARERLVLTCPAADEAGNPVIRSPFLDRALLLLPPDARRLDGADRSPGDVRPAQGETLHRADLERTALAALTERFAPGTPSEVRPHTGWALLPHLLATDAPALRAAARWFRPPEASLAEGGAARLAMARPRPRSASGLADFAQCSYRHFAGRGLGLSEVRAGAEDGIDALLAGEIAHAVLERAIGEDVRDRAGVAALVEEVFRAKAGHLRRDLRVEAVRGELLRVLPEHVASEWEAQGVVEGFSPEYVEWKFGATGPAVAAGPPDSPVALNGAADRIDLDDAGRAIVLDYKWSRMSRYAGIERKIESGAELQLPIYVLAAQRVLGVRVVAAGYLTLRDGGRRWLRVTGDAPVAQRSRVPQPAGWGEGDGSAGLAAAESQIVEFDRAIRSGACVAKPLDEDKCGAGRCPFADLCRFEGQPR